MRRNRSLDEGLVRLLSGLPEPVLRQGLLDDGAELLGMPAGLVTRLQLDGQLTILAARDPDLRLHVGMNFEPGTTLGGEMFTQAQPLAVTDVSLVVSSIVDCSPPSAPVKRSTRTEAAGVAAVVYGGA